jgi:putative membrane protein
VPSTHDFAQQVSRRLLAVGILSIPLLAASDTIVLAANEAQTKSGTDSSDTASFAKQAAIGDMFEIESSKLAATKAANSNVKQFAQDMVDAHTKTAEQLKSISDNEGIAAELPTEMDRKHAQMLSELKALSGARFERKYVELQIAAHKDAVKLFDTYAAKGKNAAFKQFAADTAPVIKAHLDHVQTLGKSMPTS